MMVGGLRNEAAATDQPLFLFDSGDMFTGLLSRLTHGEVMMEMMPTLGSAAVAGWQSAITNSTTGPPTFSNG